jgi:hypothetical protein
MGLISSDAEVVFTPKFKDSKAITTAKYKIYHGPIIFSKDVNIIQCDQSIGKSMRGIISTHNLGLKTST